MRAHKIDFLAKGNSKPRRPNIAGKEVRATKVIWLTAGASEGQLP